MEFHSKLIFLMNLTNTPNKDLAAALSVDPSLISLFRSGKRKQPHNSGYIKNMASFFAQRCPAAFQRNALSEMLGQSSIGPSMPTDVLAARLATWLAEGSEITARLFSGIGETSEVPETVSSPTLIPKLPDTISDQLPQSQPAPLPKKISSSSSEFYFGENGRKEAIQRTMDYLRDSKVPGPILVCSDDNLEWLLSDYTMTQKIQSDLKDLLARGFTLHQIMPPINFLPRFAEALQFWLPIYSSGQAMAYYYPRLRDNLYRRSLIIIPGHCIRITNSLGLGSSSDITLFSTDETIINAYITQFKEHLSMCRPAITGHIHMTEFAHLSGEAACRKGNLINMISFLSPCTMPHELFEHFIQNASSAEWVSVLWENMHQLSNFEELLEGRQYIDIACLANPDDVRAGKVLVGSSFPIRPNHPVYTPETYILHLKNILRLMERYDNYYFVPYDKNNRENYDLYVNSEGLALLVRSSSPPLMLEMQRPELVIACQEYLTRKAETIGYAGIHKETNRRIIQKLIKNLS